MPQLEKLSRGDELEALYSKEIHKEGIPLLVAPEFFRVMGAGQVDLARVRKNQNEWIVEIFEVKQGPEVSRRQLKRLYASANLLSSIFNLSSTFQLLFPKEDGQE